MLGKKECNREQTMPAPPPTTTNVCGTDLTMPMPAKRAVHAVPHPSQPALTWSCTAPGPGSWTRTARAGSQCCCTAKWHESESHCTMYTYTRHPALHAVGDFLCWRIPGERSTVTPASSQERALYSHTCCLDYAGQGTTCIRADIQKRPICSRATSSVLMCSPR